MDRARGPRPAMSGLAASIFGQSYLDGCGAHSHDPVGSHASPRAHRSPVSTRRRAIRALMPRNYDWEEYRDSHRPASPHHRPAPPRHRPAPPRHRAADPRHPAPVASRISAPHGRIRRRWIPK